VGKATFKIVLSTLIMSADTQTTASTAQRCVLRAMSPPECAIMIREDKLIGCSSDEIPRECPAKHAVHQTTRRRLCMDLQCRMQPEDER
jgi:hypothetical protein